MTEKFALIIGIESYQDTSISKVHFAEADAKDVAESLELHGFTGKNAILLLSSTATKTTIESKLRTLLAQVAQEDYFVLFYAGHGFADNDHNFITCYDTQRGDLAQTSISLQQVLKDIKSTKCHHTILFLDSCHSGLQIDANMRGIVSEMAEDELHQFFKDSEFQVGFASCKMGQKSYSSHTLSHGVWTYHLIQALKGEVLPALERKRYLTANSLQNYLSDEVPKTLRKERTDLVIQTPCMFGNLTREFSIADLQPILDEKKLESKPLFAQLKRILFSGSVRRSVESLSGFRKSHHVPSVVNPKTESFIARIGNKEVKEEAERFFQDIRKAFHYKQTDLELKTEDGMASIICKDFDLDVRITLNPKNPSEYLLKFELSNIRSPEIVKTFEFNEVFAKTFTSIVFDFDRAISIETIIDTIEKLDNPQIKIDYPSDHSYCIITLDKFDGRISLNPHGFKLEYDTRRTPSQLIQGFIEAWEILIDTHKIPLPALLKDSTS